MSNRKSFAHLRNAGLALAIAAGFVLPRSGWAETLADALVGAYTHSGLLEQNRALLRAADEDVGELAVITGVGNNTPMLDMLNDRYWEQAFTNTLISSKRLFQKINLLQ